jgi:purine-binding chemotaxis protein CheW
MEGKEIKILIFDLNGEYYATDILDVERILGYEEPTEMPDVPNFVEGVINHENRILPIINLTKKFKFPDFEISELAKIIVIKNNDKRFGIVVDNVYEVKDVDYDLFEEAPPITTKISRKFVKGLIKLEGKIVILLNMVDILSEDEERMIF